MGLLSSIQTLSAPSCEICHLEFTFTVLFLLAGCNIVRIICESSVALDQIQGVDVWRENFEQVCLNLIHSLENYNTHLPDYNKLNDFERNIFPNPQS